jgi:hypothetical protein
VDVAQENYRTPRQLEFPLDKPKVVKTKHNNVGQEEVITDERYATQTFLHMG